MHFDEPALDVGRWKHFLSLYIGELPKCVESLNNFGIRLSLMAKTKGFLRHCVPFMWRQLYGTIVRYTPGLPIRNVLILWPMGVLQVSVLDANNPAEILDSFHVCSSHLLCIASVPGQYRWYLNILHRFFFMVGKNFLRLRYPIEV